MEYKIERKPMPKRGAKGRARKYPFGDMQLGDSITFKTDEEFHKARQAAWQYGLRMGFGFLCDKSKRSIWRTK